jgi:hypothetical protein
MFWLSYMKLGEVRLSLVKFGCQQLQRRDTATLARKPFTVLSWTWVDLAGDLDDW